MHCVNSTANGNNERKHGHNTHEYFHIPHLCVTKKTGVIVSYQGLHYFCKQIGPRNHERSHKETDTWKRMTYPQNFEQKIGFDQIRHLLKEKCLSTLGQERVDEMAFSETYAEINRRLEEITEFVRIIQEEDEFPDQYFFDVRPSLKRIRVEGMYLEEQELFDLRRSLETIRDIVRFLQRNEAEEEEDSDATYPYPYLHELAGDILVFPQLISRINSILDKYGKIKDNASPELLRIRRELASTTGSISRSLHAILRNAQAEGYVDKDVTPTMRDGRLVIPVAP